MLHIYPVMDVVALAAGIPVAARVVGGGLKCLRRDGSVSCSKGMIRRPWW